MLNEDTAGVIAPPPFLYVGTLAVALLVNWLRPLPITPEAVTRWPGVAVALVGLLLALWGRRALVAAETNINPYKPTTAIVSSGPFRFSRNPLYLAMTLMYLGLTLASNTWWGIVFLLPLLLVMHFGVVRREERYLEAKFGEPYLAYRRRVRRYM